MKRLVMEKIPVIEKKLSTKAVPFEVSKRRLRKYQRGCPDSVHKISGHVGQLSLNELGLFGTGIYGWGSRNAFLTSYPQATYFDRLGGTKWRFIAASG